MAIDRMPEPPFAVRAATDAADCVIAVYGEVDAATAPDLLREIERGLDGPAPRVVVDLSNLRFIDSTGLHVLLTCWRDAQARGRALVLLRPRPPVDRAFEVTGLDTALPFAG